MKEFIASLDLESIPRISLGTAALVIAGACAALALLRGAFRLLFGSLVLCGAGAAAWFVWRHGASLPGHQLPWVGAAAPAVAGIVVFWFLRSILRFVSRPFGREGSEETPRRSPARRLVVLLFSLVPAGLLWFGGATVLRHAGSVAEIQRFADGSKAGDDRSAFLARLKETIDRTLPREWFRHIDPLSEDARLTLAKLIALGDAGVPPKAIPVLEEPEIRALILDDPKLRELARAGRYADILRDPRLDHVMADPDLKKLLGDLRL